MVAATAAGGDGNVIGALSTSAPHRTAKPSWLASHSQGEMVEGSVVFHAPSTVFQAPGGGENQLIQTGRALEELGITVRLFSSWTDRLEEARLLHLFGMSREGLALAGVARAKGVRIALSPICWVEPKAIAAQSSNFAHRTWEVAKWRLKGLTPRMPCWRRDLLNSVDAVLPNSEAEGRQLVRLFGVAPAKLRAVPNGVQPQFVLADPRLFHSRHGLSEFVLYVGRIEPRKNVLGLIKAVDALRIPLVVIGEPPPGQESYAVACREAGGQLVQWLGRLEHDDPMMASAYAAARVFALPSWFETPGLAALEAALAGCSVVITPFGCTREYFGNLVEYAAPDQPARIRQSILRAWAKEPDRQLAAHIQTNFLWSEVASRTAEVYEQLAE